MQRSFHRLSSVLKLEAQQGYKNKAVVGGIRQFVTYWIGQAREEAQDEVDRAFVEQTAEALGDYETLPGQAARERLIERLLEKLEERQDRLTPPAPPKPPPPPKREPPAVKEKPQRKKAPRPSSEVAPDPAGLAQSIQEIRGIGPRIASLFEKLSVSTIEDLLYLFPRRYDDYTLMKPINRLKYGEQVTIIGSVWEVRARKARNNSVVVQAVVSDGTGKISVSWFNQRWLIDKLKSGHRIVLAGKVEQYLGRPVMNSPEWELLSMDALRTGQIVPIYPLTQGLTNHRLRQIMQKAVPYWAQRIADPVPDQVLETQKLMGLPQAIKETHLPQSQDRLIQARRRLIFDEMFLLQLGMFAQRREWQQVPGRAIQTDGEKRQAFIDSLPYALTSAQSRVIEEITADMRQATPMSRLLQGDVGAGKTVVAAAAMVEAAAAGVQAALMAPTEILAEQHYRGLDSLLSPLGISVTLLTGRLSAAARAEAVATIADGSAQVVVGTHALIQEDVVFANLGLAVVDEQHRFGVDQRAALKTKGPAVAEDILTPHLLVMSATPIPRSLALSMFGDLDLSVLDEMPPGRQEIKTHWLRPRERERCYAFVRGQVEKGRQAYIICPLVEESDKIEAVAATQEYERLQKEVFPDLKLGLVHGKLPAAEKEAAMRAFYDNELHVLVATSVIEVGVDVPNSTVMVIEGANRFGLAQLHQFRGRVGRGSHESYCLLIADETTPVAEERLMALEQTNDGFQLAEKDLQIRGPGEFFGRRQSGLPELQMASLTDMTMLQAARDEAAAIFEVDPYLEQPSHQALHHRVERFWENAADVS